MDSLPPHILDQIVYCSSTHSYFDGPQIVNPKQLLPICLINQAFLTSAQPLLYRRIFVNCRLSAASNLSIDRKSTLFYRTLTENSKVRNYVSSFSIRFTGNSVEAEIDEQSLVESNCWISLLDMIELLPDVSYFHMLDDMKPFIDLSWRYLHHAVGKIKALQVLGLKTDSTIPCSTFCELLQPLSSLNFVEVECGASDEGRDLEPFVVEVTESPLEQITFLSIGREMNCTELIKRSNRLKSLNLRNFKIGEGSSILLKFGESLQSVLLHVAPTLGHLSVKCSNFMIEEEIPSLQQLEIAELPQLKKFSIYDWIFDLQCSVLQLYKTFFSGLLQSLSWNYDEAKQCDCFTIDHLKLIELALLHGKKQGNQLQAFSMVLCLVSENESVMGLRLGSDKDDDAQEIKEYADSMRDRFFSLGLKFSCLVSMTSRFPEV